MSETPLWKTIKNIKVWFSEEVVICIVFKQLMRSKTNGIFFENEPEKLLNIISITNEN